MIPMDTLATFFLASVLLGLAPGPDNIFFLVFLPQFADPARGFLSLQMMLLGGVFIVATILVFGSIAWLAGSIGQWLNRSPKTQVVMNRLAGTVFVGLALKLATVKQ